MAVCQLPVKRPGEQDVRVGAADPYRQSRLGKVRGSAEELGLERAKEHLGPSLGGVTHRKSEQGFGRNISKRSDAFGS